MADNQGSARVTLREIDLSQVRDPEVLPQGVPAAVVGPAKRGPAFVPKTFANVQQFGEIFGSLSEISQDSNANRFGPLAINEWLRNAESGAYVRVLGIGDGDGTLDSSNKTTGAGFIVGNKLSSYNGTKLVDNVYAAYESDANAAASKAGLGVPSSIDATIKTSISFWCPRVVITELFLANSWSRNSPS